MGRSRERLGLLLAVSVLAVGAVAVPWFTPGPALAITPVFNGNVLVDDAGSPAGSPRIAVGSDGVIHVVWTDARTGTSHAYYSRSVDDGASWSPSVRVDDAPAAVPAFEPDVAVSPGGSDVYVAYRDLRNGNWDIFSARSPDAGLTWRTGVRVDDAPGSATAHHPVLAVDAAGTVYTAWEDWRNVTSQYQVFASASASRGASWSRNVQVSDTPGGVTASSPAIASAGASRPVVAWNDEEIVSGQPVDRILSARSPDSGATWARSTIAAGVAGSSLYGADIAADAGAVYATWTYRATGADQSIVLSRSTDAGATWGPWVRVDDTPRASGAYPDGASVNALSGKPFVVWDDLRNGNRDVFASGSADGGTTWGDCPTPCAPDNDARVDDTGTATSYQQRAASAGGPLGIYAVWQDERSWPATDVYFAVYAGAAAGITEFTDSPDGTGEAVEIASLGGVDVDMAGYRLVIDGASYDLAPLGAIPPGGHAVVGNAPSADLRPAGFAGLGNEGGVIELYSGTARMDVVAYGQRGVAPDPLPSMSAARYFDGNAYTDAWSLDPTPTLGSRNDGPGIDPTPPIVLNEVYVDAPAGQEARRFVELYLTGPGPLDPTGLRLVGGTAYDLPSGPVLGPSRRFAIVGDADSPAFFAAARTSGDNLYLFNITGALLDMVGWTSVHGPGASVCRATDGGGTHDGFDDATSVAAGWRFGCLPDPRLIELGPSQTVYAELGEIVPYDLAASNNLGVPVTLDVTWSAPPSGWTVAAYAADGTTPLGDSNGNSLPDLIVAAGGSSGFVVTVTVPPLTPPEDAVVTEVVATDPATGGSATADLGTNLYPFLEVDRWADPTTVNVRGTGSGEETTITVQLLGRGRAIPGQGANATDVVFVVDDTGSMGPWIDAAKTDITRITDSILENVSSVRFGLVSYGDVAEIDVDMPLTGDVVAFKDAVNALFASGGGDTPEDPDVALEIAANLSWRGAGVVRIIVLIGDAEAHDNVHLVGVAHWANVTLGVHTNAIACGSDANAILWFNRTAAAGAGFFNNLGNPTAMADAIIRGILALVPPVDRVARDPNTSDADPMVRDVLPPYLAVVPGTFRDPATGAAKPPAYTGLDGSGNTVLEWNVTSLHVNDTWAVAYTVTSARAGWLPTNVPGLSRASFLNWRDARRAFDLPPAPIRVLAPGPVTALAVGEPRYVSDVTYVRSNTSLSFSVVDRSGLGIRRTLYRVDGGPWTNYTASGPFTLPDEGEHVVEWSSEDFLGGVEVPGTAVLRVDDTPPALAPAVGDPKVLDTGIFVTSGTPFRLTASDGGVTPVGLASLEYRIDDGPWLPFEGPFPLAGEGVHAVAYRAADRLGNAAAVGLEATVDDTPPDAGAAVGEPKHATAVLFVTSSTPVTLSAEDRGAVPVGLASLEYGVEGAAWTPYTAPFRVAGPDGWRTIAYRAADRLGNAATRSLLLSLDDTPPATTIAPGQGPFRPDDLYSLSAEDGGCGLARTEFRIDGGPWLPYAGPFPLPAGAAHVVGYRSVDRLNNTETERQLEVTYEIARPSEVNWKPAVAAVFTIALAGVGAWSARRAPWRGDPRRRAALAAFAAASLPFVLAEALTGVVSYVTGLLSIPPLLGLGTLVDLAVLVAGLALAGARAARRGRVPPPPSDDVPALPEDLPPPPPP